ncbi:MAG: DUF1848 family protein [Candidatus Eisenbacteria sp.]|nr:DUF1848 family protein [Candidatus Eisenbacteria bacterium]
MPLKPVVSASRRIDMVASCPDRLLAILAERFPPEQTHTVVIWTKAPRLLVDNAILRRCIARYTSVFLHVTITGMGASPLEPRVPPMEDSLGILADLADLVSGPEHLAVRFDPIVHLRLPDGREYCNLDHFETVAQGAARHGIRRIIVSWMQIYRKVETRLARVGVEVKEPVSARRAAEAKRLRRVSEQMGLHLQGCCVPGWPRGKCIDGAVLGQIHPARERCSRARAKGQRDLCGCTHSIDIGWYGPCVHGCLYCYANPLFRKPAPGEWGRLR